MPSSNHLSEQPHHPPPRPFPVRVLTGAVGLFLSLVPLVFLVWLSIPPARASRVGIGHLEQGCLAWPPARRSGVVMASRGSPCAEVVVSPELIDESEDSPVTVELAGP